jgi:ATP-dependent Clp protease protease subunit
MRAPRVYEPVGLEALRERLFEQRIVQLRGPLDDASAGRAAAELMALDALGDSSVQLYLDSSGGPLGSAFTLIDTIDLLGVPVHVTCVGRVEGTAVGVLAAGERRMAAPHARFHLVEPSSSAAGNAAQLVGWVEHHQAELASFVRRVAEATGRPAEHLEADMALGRWMDAEEAMAYGLVQEIWKPRRGMGSQGGTRRPFGFSPPS